MAATTSSRQWSACMQSGCRNLCKSGVKSLPSLFSVPSGKLHLDVPAGKVHNFAVSPHRAECQKSVRAVALIVKIRRGSNLPSQTKRYKQGRCPAERQDGARSRLERMNLVRSLMPPVRLPWLPRALGRGPAIVMPVPPIISIFFSLLVALVAMTRIASAHGD